MTEEKMMKTKNGFLILFLNIAMILVSIAILVLSIIGYAAYIIPGFIFAVGIILHIVLFITYMCVFAGLKIINPNEARVFSLFGKYLGTIYTPGYYFINPFVSEILPKDDKAEKSSMDAAAKGSVAVLPKKKISTKVTTLVNGKQKVNDALGNPVEISAIVVWKVVNATKAVIEVDHYLNFLSDQTDSIIRNIACLYPYDLVDENDEGQITLRSDAAEIAKKMQEELNNRVQVAGLEIIEVRLNQIAYSAEIAAAMLQRQQAVAVIAARSKIVEGAVSMVKMALDQLKEEGVVNLDEERKAQMVSNLLVVLCGSKEASPIVNTGTVY